MADSSIEESLTFGLNDSEKPHEPENSFPDAVNELGKSLFKKYPLKTSNYSSDNELGLLGVDVINEFMQKNWNYEFSALKMLKIMKPQRVMSVKGFGIEKLIESLKNLSISFEQTTIPRLMGLGKNR